MGRDGGLNRLEQHLSHDGREESKHYVELGQLTP